MNTLASAAALAAALLRATADAYDAFARAARAARTSAPDTVPDWMTAGRWS